MLNIEGADVRVHHQVSKGLSRHAVAAGDLLGFRDKHGKEHTGRVVRLNPKSVTPDVQREGRELKWRVSCGLLYRILDGQASPTEGSGLNVCFMRKYCFQTPLC